MTSNKIFLVLPLLFIILFSGQRGLAQNDSGTNHDYQSALAVDKVLSKMSVREKLAQLFIVAFNDRPNDKNTKEAIELIRKEKIGGLIIMNSSLTTGAQMINHLQSLSKIPLLVTLDGEWGAAMRFDSVIAFPRQMQMAAMRHDSLVYLAGAAIGEQTRRVGMDVNYAPSIDVNNNPANPVINIRAFGENKDVVAKYGIAYLKGMQSVGVAGSAKHFPGHGDTDIDSHHALPILPFTRERLDTLELYPFKKIIAAGTDMIMVGHLEIPALDNSGRPSSISSLVVNDLLRNEMEYNGIIITDALNMKGVSEYMPKERLPLEAYKAGSDLILMPENVVKALDIMERAVENGEISKQGLNVRTKKMLMLKAKHGILQYKEPVNLENLEKDLNKQYNKSLISEISENSLTVIKNDNNNLPLKELADVRLAYVSLGGDKFGSEFALHMLNYAKADTVVLRGKFKKEDLVDALGKFAGHDQIILAIHNTDARPQENFGIDDQELEVITEFAKDKSVTFVYFGNPLALPFLKGHQNFTSVLLAYQNTFYNNVAAVHKIFGATAANGRLPVTAGEYSFNHSVATSGGLRVAYRVPVSISKRYDQFVGDVEKIVESDIKSENYSGAHVIFIDGKNVIYNNRFGILKNEKTMELDRISQLLTLVPSIMILKEEGKISLEEFYENVLVSDLLMHRRSEEGNETDEPDYDFKNVQILREIIEKRSGVNLEQYAKEKLLDPLGIDPASFDKESVSTDVNELVKLISMLYAGGEYAGNKIMSIESAANTLLYMHYYSKNPNGSMVWTDNENQRAVIFINNGEKESITGDIIRRYFNDFINI